MADYPYTVVTGKIGLLFEKIKAVGVPPKVSNKWLASVGFKSTNDRSLIAVIKFIGFADQSGIPSDKWKMYRGKDGAAVLAQGIKEGYSELYGTYPDAHSQSDTDLTSYFSTKTSAGATSVQKTVTTFKNLCKLADFTASAPQHQGAKLGSPDGHVASSQKIVGQTPVTINITINMPESDSRTYEAFFKAMKDNLLT